MILLPELASLPVHHLWCAVMCECCDLFDDWADCTCFDRLGCNCGAVAPTSPAFAP